MGKASYTIKSSKNKYSFTYSGDLGEAIEKAKRDLQREKSNPDIPYWSWLKAKADKALKNHTDRISKIQAFIECAEEHLKKNKEEGKK